MEAPYPVKLRQQRLQFSVDGAFMTSQNPTDFHGIFIAFLNAQI